MNAQISLVKNSEREINQIHTTILPCAQMVQDIKSCRNCWFRLWESLINITGKLL